MRYSCFTLLLLLSFSSFAQSGRGPGIVYGQDHAFKLLAPQGWILDNYVAAEAGFHAVFYPEGESWQNGMTVMYANTARYSSPGNENLDSIISYDLGRFIAAKPDVEIRTAPAIQLQENKTAQIRYIYGDHYGNYEAVAYIAEQKIAVILVMSSRFKPNFEENLSKFIELLNSYDFITDDNDAIDKMVKEYGK